MRKLPISCILLLTGVVGWSADYLRDGPDNGGTGWVKGEKIFTPANVKDTKLLWKMKLDTAARVNYNCLLYTSPSPRDRQKSRMPSSA